MRVDLSSTVRDPPGLPRPRELRRWARAAAGPRGRGSTIAIRVVGLAASRRLNRIYRGRDRATNVLSFAGPQHSRGAPRMLGDLVIAAPIVQREARAQGKPLRAHWAHLIVHGCLHLTGLDHEREADARRMERRERLLLARFGFADPYETRERPLRADPARPRRRGESRAAQRAGEQR